MKYRLGRLGAGAETVTNGDTATEVTKKVKPDEVTKKVKAD